MQEFQAQYVPLSVQVHTRDRVKDIVEREKFRLQRTVTYDEMVNRAFDALEQVEISQRETVTRMAVGR